MNEHVAFIALGSNLGNSREIIHRAMDRLENLSAQPIQRSSLWRTAPVDCPPGSPDFVNAVVALTPKPAETPETLLQKLQTLEKEFGRQQKKVLNEPRPLDLDLIAFANETRASKDLVLPHPRAHQRAFVVLPLAEIASEWKFPGQNKTVAELAKALAAEQSATRISDVP